MKIIKEEKFCPITIRIETKEELNIFYTLFNFRAVSAADELFYSIWEQLKKSGACFTGDEKSLSVVRKIKDYAKNE